MSSNEFNNDNALTELLEANDFEYLDGSDEALQAHLNDIWRNGVVTIATERGERWNTQIGPVQARICWAATTDKDGATGMGLWIVLGLKIGEETVVDFETGEPARDEHGKAFRPRNVMLFLARAKVPIQTLPGKSKGSQVPNRAATEREAERRVESLQAQYRSVAGTVFSASDQVLPMDEFV